MQTNTFCHVEWSVTNFEQAKHFYGGLFGWTFTPYGDNYMVFNTPDNLGGGLQLAESKPSPCAHTVYVLVDDLESYRQKAAELGGTADEPVEIPGMGHFVWLYDLDGSRIGIFKPLQN